MIFMICLTLISLLEHVGLILNFIGTLLIAFSVGKNSENAYQVDKNGRKKYLAIYISPIRFRIGIILVLLGFLLQIITA